MKKTIMLGMSFLLIGTPLFAEENKGGLFVEPMLTYQKGKGTIKYDKTQIQAIGNLGTNSVSSTNNDNNTWIASVSFPIGI